MTLGAGKWRRTTPDDANDAVLVLAAIIAAVATQKRLTRR